MSNNTALQNQKAITTEAATLKKGFKFSGWDAKCVTDTNIVMPSFYTFISRLFIYFYIKINAPTQHLKMQILPSS